MTPDLASYDWIVINSSAGKDSQAMLDYLVELADGAGVDRARLVVVHADLGRVEWQGTKDLAAEQAAHYGLRFEVVKRSQGDLLDHVQARGKWPSPKNRYCTSDHKRGQVGRLHTMLDGETRAAGVTDRPARILNCMGMRADESTARSKLQAFSNDKRNTNGRRTVDVWLPIHTWDAERVWERIRASGVRHHTAYDLGMPRLSCCFCIFAPRAALLLAGKHNPELLAEHVRIEKAIDHKFKADLSLESIQQDLADGCQVEKVTDWNM